MHFPSFPAGNHNRQRRGHEHPFPTGAPDEHDSTVYLAEASHRVGAHILEIQRRQLTERPANEPQQHEYLERASHRPRQAREVILLTRGRDLGRGQHRTQGRAPFRYPADAHLAATVWLDAMLGRVPNRIQ